MERLCTDVMWISLAKFPFQILKLTQRSQTSKYISNMYVHFCLCRKYLPIKNRKYLSWMTGGWFPTKGPLECISIVKGNWELSGYGYDIITLTSYEYYVASDHQQLNCLFNSFLRLTPVKTWNFYVTSPLWWENSSNFEGRNPPVTGHRWVRLNSKSLSALLALCEGIPLTKGQKCRKCFHTLTSS